MAGLTASPDYAANLKAALAAAPAQGTDGGTIGGFLTNLSKLAGIPFHYLVSDPRMLPPESIRFFTLDGNWMNALLDGALSVGRPIGFSPATAPPASGSPVSGFLLRSAVIAAWPQVEVNAYDGATPANLLTPIRLEVLAPGLMLGLFQGQIASVTFAEPPEGLHFGLELPNDPQLTGAYLVAKLLAPQGSNPAGSQNKSVTPPVAPVFRDAASRVLDVTGTAAALLKAPGALGPSAPATYTPAEFALEMVVGAESVTFTIAAP